MTEEEVVRACDEKKGYEPPRLVRYGDVRDITLGGTVGAGESANPSRYP